MKYWTTLSLSTVVISGLLTWLMMRVGQGAAAGQADGTGAVVAPPHSKEPGKVSFKLAKGIIVDFNVIEVDRGDIEVGKEHSAEVTFHNEGPGPLHLQLRNKSCQCLDQVQVNDQPLKPYEWFTASAGSDGRIKLILKPTEAQLPKDAPGRNMRIHAEFYSNDSKLTMFKVEVKTQIVPANGNKQ